MYALRMFDRVLRVGRELAKGFAVRLRRCATR